MYIIFIFLFAICEIIHPSYIKPRFVTEKNKELYAVASLKKIRRLMIFFYRNSFSLGITMLVIRVVPTFKNTIAHRSRENIDVHRSCRWCPERSPKKDAWRWSPFLRFGLCICSQKLSWILLKYVLVQVYLKKKSFLTEIFSQIC